MQKIANKKIILPSVFLLILTVLFFFFRGPYISNALKGVIIPELSLATGRDITAQRLYINIFPLFIEARDIKVFDTGKVIVNIPRVKAYVSVTGLLRKEIYIRRLVIKSFESEAKAKVIEDIIKRVKEYLKTETGLPFKVKIRAVNLQNSRLELTHEDSVISLKGLNGDVLISQNKIHMARVNVSISDSSITLKNWPHLRGTMRSSFFIREDSIDLKDLDLKINGSDVAFSGIIPFNLRGGEIKTKFKILMETMKGISGLKNSGDGEIRAEGTIRFLKDLAGVRSDLFNSILIDMDVKGGFYIQSLLEMVRVKEKIEGPVEFSGKLRGPLNSLTGKGRAFFKDGNLYGISVNALRCNVSYSEGMLAFSDGRASLYNGTAQATASVQIYGGGFHSVYVKAEDIDSPPLLNLIGWRPDIPVGKVRGEFKTSGTEFAPSGWFEYKAIARRDDYILKRVNLIKGLYSMEGDILTLRETMAETTESDLLVNGRIDIASSTLDLETELLSKNIEEISPPFLKDLSGAGRFSGTVKGQFDDPLISGWVSAETVSLYGHKFGQVRADIDYRKKSLIIKDLTSKMANSVIELKGSIGFPEAKELFELRNPVYNLSATVRNYYIKDSDQFLKSEKSGLLSKASISGIIYADLTIKGRSPEISGLIKISNPAINDLTFDSANGYFVYEDGSLRVRDFLMKSKSGERESVIHGNGDLKRDETLTFRLWGNVSINDILKKATFPLSGIINFQASGKGRIDNPEMVLTANLSGGSIKKANIGDGRIKALIKDKELTLESLLFNEKAILRGSMDLRDLSWRARVELRAGRYDSLILTFLKDVPEDLLLNIKGSIDVTGKREHFTAIGLIDELNVNLYGQSFSSERDIGFSMKDWRINIPAVKMRSGTTSFAVQGVIDINREIDISLEGRSNLSPLKGFSKKIETVRGDAEFVLSVSGKWDSPKVNGGLSISNAFLGLRGIPHRLSSAQGYLYIDEDKVIIDRLSGKLGGGDIEMSGITYLKGLTMKKFYIDLVVNDITLTPSKDFPVNFNGNLLLRGTPESRSLSGEIRIKKARYKERVEWKSWLLKTKSKERLRGEAGAIENTELNVKIHGSENIIIDNNIARAPVKVDLLLRGTVLQPIIFGRVESAGGNVYFRNNEFRIIKASADFSDPKRINPVMEIVAETSIKGYNIRLNLEGQMEHFNLSLLSDPPLPEIDILSLLTVGKFGKELKGIESGIGAGEATSFLTGKMQDVIEERVRSLTGLDRLEVDPYVSKTTGTISPRVTVSKRLLGDRLFVTYSSAVGTTENNVLKLEYILNRNISLIGVRDEKGGIGGDIKFRFEFK